MGFEKSYGGSRVDGWDRVENDYYPTPPFVTWALCNMGPIKPPVSLWEPAAGRGWMARELNRCGHTLRATDLHAYDRPLFSVETGVDFLVQGRDWSTRGMVTNPPYASDLAQRFVEKALAMEYPYVAVLCRLPFLTSGTRYTLFKRDPPSNVLVFSQRFSCAEDRWINEKPGGGMIDYAWFVWDASVSTVDTKIDWIDTAAAFRGWRNSGGRINEEDVTCAKTRSLASLADFAAD